MSFIRSADPHDDISSFVVEKGTMSYPVIVTFTDGSRARGAGAKGWGSGAADLGAVAAAIWP